MNYWRRERDCGRTFSGYGIHLFGCFLGKFEGLPVLTVQAVHPDRRKHFKIFWVVGRVIGQRDIGQWSEGTIDEGEVGSTVSVVE